MRYKEQKYLDVQKIGPMNVFHVPQNVLFNFSHIFRRKKNISYYVLFASFRVLLHEFSYIYEFLHATFILNTQNKHSREYT